MGLSDLMLGATNHLAGQGGGFEPQRNNNVLFLIYGLEKYGVASTKGPLANVLGLALESFPVPSTSNDVIEMGYFNAKRKVAGQKQTDECELVLRDFIDAPVAAVMHNWRNEVQDPQTERMGLARNYKKNGEVFFFGPDGTYQRRLRVEGIWPSRFSQGEADHNGGDKMLVQATLQFDKVFPVTGSWGTPILRPLGSDIQNLGSVAATVLNNVLNNL